MNEPITVKHMSVNTSVTSVQKLHDVSFKGNLNATAREDGASNFVAAVSGRLFPVLLYGKLFQDIISDNFAASENCHDFSQ